MVPRSRRLEPVVEVTADVERRAARAFGEAETRVAAAEQKLAELERYAQDYRGALRERTATGIDAPQLQAFHGFIGRLGEAVAQQALAVRRACEERDLARERWLEASRRARAVGKVAETAAHAERREQDRRDQHDFDERAQRAYLAAAASRPR